MKNLAKLNGAKTLSKNEQKSINGGCAYKGCDKCLTSPNGVYCIAPGNTNGCCQNGFCVTSIELCNRK